MLRFVRESPGKVGRREIARAFGIRGNDRAALTELLRALEEEGALEGRHSRRRAPGTLPAVTVLEVEGLDSDGALTARPASWEEPDPPPPITLDPAPRGGARAGGGRPRAGKAQARAGRRLPGPPDAPARFPPPPGGRHLPRGRARRRDDRARRSPIPPRPRRAGGGDRRRPLRRAGGGRDPRGPPPWPARRPRGRAPGRGGFAGRDQHGGDPRPRPAGALPRRGAGGGGGTGPAGPRRARGPARAPPRDHRRRGRPRLRRRSLGRVRFRTGQSGRLARGGRHRRRGALRAARQRLRQGGAGARQPPPTSPTAWCRCCRRRCPPASAR